MEGDLDCDSFRAGLMCLQGCTEGGGGKGVVWMGGGGRCGVEGI